MISSRLGGRSSSQVTQVKSHSQSNRSVLPLLNHFCTESLKCITSDTERVNSNSHMSRSIMMKNNDEIKLLGFHHISSLMTRGHLGNHGYSACQEDSHTP